MVGERHFEISALYRPLPFAMRESCGVLRGALVRVRGEAMCSREVGHAEREGERLEREGVHAEREGERLEREGVRAEREGERSGREGVRVRCAPTCTGRSGDRHGSRVISARQVVWRILPGPGRM